MSTRWSLDSTRARRWLATGDAVVPRAARLTLRGLSRLRARIRSGSVAAEMDRIVAEATSNRVGSGLTVPNREMSRRRRRRSDGAPGRKAP